MVLSEQSYRLALAVAPKVSASLSIAGSAFIIRDVMKQRRELRRQQQQRLPATLRIILSMSVADLGSSFWAHFLSTWMVPRGTEHATLAAGNGATCATQSFFYELFIYAGTLSNAFLAIAYWLTICREMKERTLRQWKWHFLLVGLPWMLGLLNATPKIVLASASFNNYWWCELAPGSVWDNLLDYVMLGICFVMIIFSMIALIRYVYKNEKRMDQFTSTTNLEDHHQREKTKRVAGQGLWYIAMWIFIVVPTIVVTVLDDMLPNGFFVFWSLLFPLQGFCNALVYFRPKYKSERTRERRSGRRSTAFGSAMHVLGVSWIAGSAGMSSRDARGQNGKDSNTSSEGDKFEDNGKESNGTDDAGANV